MNLQSLLRRELPGTLPAVMGFCLLAVLCAVPCAGQGQNGQQQRPHYPRREFHHEVQALEQEYRQAELKGDTATLERLLADDYTGINSNGLLMSREQTIERMRTRQVTFKKLDLSEVKVSVHGDTAIVTSRAEVESIQNGEERDGVFRYTRVYQRRGTDWKIVNFESTRINPSATEGNDTSAGGSASAAIQQH